MTSLTRFLSFVLLTLLLLPSTASPLTLPFIKGHFQRHFATVGSQGSVLMWEEACRLLSPEECLEPVKEWTRKRGVHPLTVQALKWLNASQLRRLGRFDEAVKLTGTLGFVSRWWAETESGEDVPLVADPVSGMVDTHEFLELTAGRILTVHTTIDVPRNGAYVLRFMGSGLKQICISEQCSEFPRAKEYLFDGVVHPVTLEAGEQVVKIQFLLENSGVEFALRITDARDKPATVLWKEDGPGRVSPGTPNASKTPPTSALSTLLLAPSPLDACFLVKEQGIRSGESPEGLVADWTPDTLEEGLALLDCLDGSPAALSQAEELLERFPDSPALRLMKARFENEENRPFRSWMSLKGTCPNLQFSCLPHGLAEWAFELLERLWVRQDLPLTSREVLCQAYRDLPTPARGGRCAEKCIEMEAYNEALAVLKDANSRWPGDSQLLNSRLFVLEKLDTLEDRLVILATLRQLYPQRTWYRIETVRTLELLGQHQEARDAALELAKARHRHPSALESCAEALYAIGEKKLALEVWQRLAAIRPQDRELKGWLASATGKGEGGAPIPTEERIRELAQKVPTDPGHPFVGVLDETRIELFENGASSTVQTRVIKAVEPDPDQSYSLDFSYDSHLEFAQILKAVRLTADGRTVPATETGEQSVSDPEYNLYYDVRHVVARFEDVEPGDILILSQQVDAASSTISAPFSGVFWVQESYPRYNTSVELVVPEGEEIYYNISVTQKDIPHQVWVTPEEGRRSTLFVFPAVPAITPEPYAPGRYERLLYLHYSTQQTWKEFVHWYSELAYRQVGQEPALAELVSSMKAKHGEGPELREALCRFVADDIRYVGLELGAHGLQPYSPVDVLERGFGDCKDMSLLLVTLLRLAGFPADLVVVATANNGKPTLEPASPALFDHAIVYLPDLDQFFDPTARYLSLDSLPWQDQGARAIIVDEKNPRVVDIPESVAKDNYIDFDLEVVEGDPPTVAGKIRVGGQFVRRILSALEDKGNWSQNLEAWVGGVLPVVTGTTSSHVVHLGTGPYVEIEFVGVWVPSQGNRHVLLRENPAPARAVQESRRKTPMVFAHPYRYQYVFRFIGSHFDFPRDLRLLQRTDDLQVRVETVETKVERELTFEYLQRTPRVPLEDYSSFRDLVLEIHKIGSSLEVITLPGGDQ